MSSRRDLTDDSGLSTTSTLTRDVQFPAEYLATDLESDTDTTILQKVLNTRSTITTSSEFLTKSQHASKSGHQVFTEIGKGLQGAIFEQVGMSPAFKKEHVENESRVSRLAREYDAHVKIYSAFQNIVEETVLVPRPMAMISVEDNTFWTQHLDQFSVSYRTRTAIFPMERILPLPKIVRKALITHLYPRDPQTTSVETDLVQDLLSKPSNKHCLARIYLGKSSHTFSPEGFSLRNLPLCLDSMQMLGLDTAGFARSMGQAYAVIQWGAGFNGDDVEFVLGTIAEDTASNLQRRAVKMWLLDFGQCEIVDMDDDAEVIYQRFRGALVTGDNQWFIPHCLRDRALFAAFRSAYVETGRPILESKGWLDRFDMEEFMDSYEEYAEDFLELV